MAILLLIFNGIGAVYGGMHFILHPDGTSLGMYTQYLQHTAFRNYFIPGIILLIVNGVFSLLSAALTIVHYRFYPYAVILQGAILFGWIVVQVILLQFTFVLHFVMAAVGILLMLFGVYLMLHQRGKRMLA